MQEQQDVAQEQRRTLAPVAASAPAARRLLRELLAASTGSAALLARLDDAELALSELVTNAVLHGREPIELLLRLTGSGLRVEVRDGNPVSPSFSMLDATAVTGRGLFIVSGAADAWGVEPHLHGKTVWFEMRADGVGRRDEQEVDRLLEAWGDDLQQDPADEVVRVVLTGLQTLSVAHAEAHVEGLLRELALLEGSATAPAEHQQIARQVLEAAAAVDGMRSELKRQFAAAVAAGAPLVDVELRLVRGDGEAVRDFSRALDEADALSRAGRLLAEPVEHEVSDARSAYLRRVLAQLAS